MSESSWHRIRSDEPPAVQLNNISRRGNLTPEDADIDAAEEHWGDLRTVVPPTYPESTAGSVTFLPVTLDDSVVGYISAADDGTSAGYLPRAVAGEAGRMAGGLWVSRFWDAYAAKLTPVQAIRRARTLQTSQAHLFGFVAAAATERHLPTLAELYRFAGVPHPNHT
ncbi:hypothetical protein [Nocardia aurantia]|uniref:Uncharacterized protein n=1 Tax=Nocardia aurantia TaxID=2585199 RepID=A0A7K0DJN2_9NOCA|nr:hypothetical protein [Nocardia aurantia]MQY24994.1 hypothetical protein [Nocardia aurantia]